MEQFYEWIDLKFKNPNNRRKNLLFYPEGHRNYSDKPLRLRTGMLRYAYERKVPLQMVLSHGYDEVLNEKVFKSSFDTIPVIYRAYEPIIPEKYSTCEEYLEDVSKLYEERFADLTNSAKEAARHSSRAEPSAKGAALV
eukprot:CAMPEP_0204919456 /NCGR_PEP_ID=MMETSP1397-20131031/16830_1 /ASSEMBLY_ACC=CAM_ASM_000891 /TAXON_ID=49980 /ORGANISM="Climacostomum Climacostomum virens, Strain Stock W-24" /LENGTH=138 /DNA_ID=CAMNT_0052093047 /DNA_START=378 /DNA_END=793 /DNA_ORIENTATION=-